MLKPPLKWAGGKRWLVPRLALLYEAYGLMGRRLVEPFCGGLAVALGINPKKALLNDINAHAIAFYKWLQVGFTIDSLLLNDRDFYGVKRREFNALTLGGKEQDKRASELFYYLNRTGFNGLCRFNQKGGFNVPFGKYKTINYQRDFTEYSEVLSGWEFLCGDFRCVPVAPGDFIYADPPYDVDFRQYSKEGFSWEDQVRLVGWLSLHKGPVVASNQATDRIVELYKGFGFKVEIIDAPRRISCDGNRDKAKEILAMRNVGEVGS